MLPITGAVKVGHVNHFSVLLVGTLAGHVDSTVDYLADSFDFSSTGQSVPRLIRSRDVRIPFFLYKNYDRRRNHCLHFVFRGKVRSLHVK